eukprot:7977799-Lingulodinium_polyedra.AAC.1
MLNARAQRRRKASSGKLPELARGRRRAGPTPRQAVGARIPAHSGEARVTSANRRLGLAVRPT